MLKFLKALHFKSFTVMLCISLQINLCMAQESPHIYPKRIAQQAQKALAFYPELNNVAVAFEFKTKIKKSTMQAQPRFGSLFKSRAKRSYVIMISERIKIADSVYKTADVPEAVMIGWLGHELGHVMDYQRMTNLQLIWFGVKYLLFDNHIIEAERAADTFAVAHGMANYILETKNFILNNADIDSSYKLRIQKYYLSPEEIMELVNAAEN